MNELRALEVESAAVPGSTAGLPSADWLEREPASYRDRNGTVFYRDGRVFRFLSRRALANWQRLEAAPFFRSLCEAGKVIETRLADPQNEGITLGTWAGVLEHARLPFVSYPYEWSFSMLKDAALLHLELMRGALAADMILKDSSAYNIQWNGVSPTFIDLPSFEPLGRGDPWVGYRQFCEMFLYPLMLRAYKGADYRPWLRGRLDGIPAEEMRALMSAHDLLRPGVLLHVAAQAALQKRYSRGKQDVRGALAQAGFDKKLIERNVDKLTRLVAKLDPAKTKTVWADYDRTHSYDEAELAAKADFVREAASTRRWRLAWDLGCNTGTFSRIVAEQADYVVAMDGDWMAIERLYRRERDQEGARNNILPLVVNLADASPNQGWGGSERKGLAERGKPDLTLCLALIHHMVISANIPLAEFIGWLAKLGTSVVIEFVGREDEMVQTLLANREDQYWDYTPETFRLLMDLHFEIRADRPLKGGKRHIYFAVPR
ncbi:class I SAM-dependent methyltransferase [Chelativorans sp. Marseille-P2723]|uniref:class I SAM-dependent methyltransferase n=1 Tax=Chelativorans sp. Marseille-P2723 TaxID=2709133 RepID=UPI00156FE370|nr:class I SAM-dependent methyltransferase [Chelativorans sp. Marseille-P2723]